MWVNYQQQMKLTMEAAASVIIMLVSVMQLWSFSVAETPALFIFGDSLVDVGNNNFMSTFSRANYPPYGMDFDEQRPTGRFSDGRLIPDYIASYLGLPFPPAYLGAGENIRAGVNFASGGSGLYETTGSRMGEHFPLFRQVQNFRRIKQRLDASLGAYNSSILISKSIFYITTGNNDFANNYYASSELQRNYTLSDFEDRLISILREQIEELYGLNARKFVITSVAALGCNPMSLYTYRLDTPGECASTYDSAARGYNNKLQSLLIQLRSSLTEANLVYANLYGIMTKVIKNGTGYGFPNVNEPCCPYGGYFNCFLLAPTCNNTSDHIFWDLFHPTGRFNQFVARRFWAGDTTDVSPINLRRLANSMVLWSPIFEIA